MILCLIVFSFLAPSAICQSDTLVTIRRTLNGAYGVDFGSNEEKTITSIGEGFNAKLFREIKRENFEILDFRKIRKDRIRIDRLRVFVHPEEGVFIIEEEADLRWNLQKPRSDNFEMHKRRLEQTLDRLRKRYGDETILQEADIGKRFLQGSVGRETDFVTATWQFDNNRWIHLIYEPQDWSLLPELFKIVVIYRDSARYNRVLRSSVSATKR